MLLYADDIILITDTKERLQQAVNEWYEELKRKGMSINIDKSKIMRVTKDDRQQEDVKDKLYRQLIVYNTWER